LLCEYNGSSPELYDLDSDRGETTDVAAQHPNVAQGMTSAVVDWHQSMPQDNGATYRLKPKKKGRSR
ncbi:MAG: N-acetylgalactosamine-6-sulfatase, partial [Rhodopirellula bahusiensis]